MLETRTQALLLLIAPSSALPARFLCYLMPPLSNLLPQLLVQILFVQQNFLQIVVVVLQQFYLLVQKTLCPLPLQNFQFQLLVYCTH